MRRRWLPAVAACEAIGALALTEPQVGSDLKAITTTITATGDEIVVDGHKSFITNAGDATFYLVLGREGDGYSMVLVPVGAPGVSVAHPHQIIAPHVLGDVIFDHVRVPVGHRIGEPGKAFTLALATLATFRVSVMRRRDRPRPGGARRGGAAHHGTRPVRGAARPARPGAEPARHVLGRDRDGAVVDLPRRRGRRPRPAGQPAPVVHGEGGRDGGHAAGWSTAPCRSWAGSAWSAAA